MGKSLFENTTLYESMIQTDDEEEVNKVLLNELKERNVSEKKFEEMKNYSISYFSCENPNVYVDCCMYFGIKSFNLEELIRKCIMNKTLHKAFKYGIVEEKINELIMINGLDYILHDALYDPQCYNNEKYYDDIYGNEKSSETKSNLIRKIIPSYVFRCLYPKEYIYDTLLEYSQYNEKTSSEYNACSCNYRNCRNCEICNPRKQHIGIVSRSRRNIESSLRSVR